MERSIPPLGGGSTDSILLQNILPRIWSRGSRRPVFEATVQVINGRLNYLWILNLSEERLRDSFESETLGGTVHLCVLVGWQYLLYPSIGEELLTILM